MSYRERRLRRDRRAKTPQQLHHARCKVCFDHIPPCGGNYQCVHRLMRLCIKHMAAAYAT